MKYWSLGTREKFRKLFRMDIMRFVDTQLSVVTGQQEFNVFKLDEVFDVPDGVSTKDYVTQCFGEEAANLVIALIQCDDSLYRQPEETKCQEKLF